MEKMQQGVLDFHKTYGAVVGDLAMPLPHDRIDLRLGLIEEELDELKTALANADMVESVDACIDIIYVTLGLLVEMGVDAEPLFDEVQRSNMSKLGADGKPIVSRGVELDGFPEGKVLKGPNYFKPNLAGIIRRGAADLAREQNVS